MCKIILRSVWGAPHTHKKDSKTPIMLTIEAPIFRLLHQSAWLFDHPETPNP